MNLINRGTLLQIVLAVVVIALVIVGSVKVAGYLDGRLYPTVEAPTATPVPEEKKRVQIGENVYVAKENLVTTLVMGIDSFEQVDTGVYVNNTQADFLALLVQDQDFKVLSVIQINRDSMTSIPVLSVMGKQVGRAYAQVALAHTYGSGQQDSCENTVDAVEYLLNGVKIDHYISISMDGIAHLNDYVGGVPVVITEDMTAVDPAFVSGETVYLEGDQALSFIRARGSLVDKTNLARMDRQKTYIEAWIDIFMQNRPGPEETAKLLTNVGAYILSDMTPLEIQSFADGLSDYKDGGVFQLKGENKVGARFMEYTVDQTALQELICELFYDRIDL